MASPRSRRRAAPLRAWSRRAPTHVGALALVITAVLLAFGFGFGAGAAAQGTPSTTTTRPSSTSSSSLKPSSTVAPSTAVPTTAALTTAPPTTAETTTTTVASTTTTTVATTSTLVVPPPLANARFPARLVAPVPPVEGGPQLVVNALYLAASEDAQAPDVVVHFKAPFTLPSSKYQVALLVGDPNGQRVRVSFVSTGANQKPSGTVESGDGTTWAASGTTQVQHDPSGFIVIRVPLAATPAGGAVWTEITEGSSNTPVRSPFFDRTAFFGSADAGTVPASRFGRVNTPDGKAAPEVAALDAGPTVTVNQKKISVKYNEAPPTALVGQPVKEVVDLVRIVPNFDTAGVVGDFIRIDRNTAQASLFDGFGATPLDKSGDRSWVVRGPDAPPGPTTLVFDLDLAAQQLGIPLEADRTAIGLTRSFVLADGRIVTADGVVATNAWLDLAPPPLSAAPEAAAPAAKTSSTGGRDRTVMIAGAAAAAVLVLVGIVLLGRRRRHREDAAVTAAIASRAEAGDRIPWARNDSQLTQELDRVVIPGTAENSLLLVSGEVAVTPPPAPGAPDVAEPVVAGLSAETAAADAAVASVVAASVAAVAAVAVAAPAPDAPIAAEAEPPPSVGHAGPIPWRSGAADQAAIGGDEATAATSTPSTPETPETPEAPPRPEPGPRVLAGAGATGPEAEPVPRAAPDPESVDGPTSAAAPSAAAAIVAESVAESVSGAEPVAAPPAATGTVAPTPAGVAAVATAPLDRRRRRASGVVIAGPSVRDVLTPAGPPSLSRPAAADVGADVGADVAWAASDTTASAAPDSDTEVSDPGDEIDPSDALAALDLDLGSFRTRLGPDDA